MRSIQRRAACPAGIPSTRNTSNELASRYASRHIPLGQPAHYQVFAAATILPLYVFDTSTDEFSRSGSAAVYLKRCPRGFLTWLDGMWKIGTFKATACIQSGVECVETR